MNRVPAKTAPWQRGCTFISHGFLLALGIVLAQPAAGASVREYHRILLSDPIDLDPARIEDVNALQIMLQAAEGLVELEHNNISPAIAERWEISTDLREYQFHLNPKALFSNGVRITADDVVHSFHYLLGDSSLVWRELSVISGATEYHEGKNDTVTGIEKIGPQLVKFTLERPFSPFLEIIATPPFVVLPQQSFKILHEKKVAPFVSSGPYQLVHYEKTQSVQLERNPYHRAADRVYFDRIVYNIVRNPLLAKAGFFGGLYADIWPIFIRDVPLQSHGHFERIPAYSAGTWYLEFNLNNPSVANLALRRFIASNLDRRAFLLELQLPTHFAATRFIPRGLVGYREAAASAEVVDWQHELAQAGCLPEKPCVVELIYEKDVSAALEKLFRPIREQHADRVHIILQKLERHAWYQRFITGAYAMLYIGNNARYSDAYSMLNYLMMDQYHPGLQREEIGRQLELAFETSDRVVRGNHYARVDDLLLQQYAVVPIYHGVVPYLFVRKGYVGHKVPILGPHHIVMSNIRQSSQ
ncbi:MAG: hypothetical protein HY696_00020 [Deltaproteobacteria bacterium]|nr:hypothetical protein [Deltaproteobacteria bacterium]